MMAPMMVGMLIINKEKCVEEHRIYKASFKTWNSLFHLSQDYLVERVQKGLGSGIRWWGENFSIGQSLEIGGDFSKTRIKVIKNLKILIKFQENANFWPHNLVKYKN